MYVAGESELVLKSHSLDIEAKSQVSSRTEVGRKKTQKRRLGLGRKVENCPSTWTWSSDNLNASGLPFTRSQPKNMGHNLKLFHFFNSRASSYLPRVQLCCGRETHFKAKPSLGGGRLIKPSLQLESESGTQPRETPNSCCLFAELDEARYSSPVLGLTTLFWKSFTFQAVDTMTITPA